MSLLVLLGVLIIVAILYWALNQLPLPPVIKTIITVLGVVLIVLWLVQAFLGINLSTLSVHS